MLKTLLLFSFFLNFSFSLSQLECSLLEKSPERWECTYTPVNISDDVLIRRIQDRFTEHFLDVLSSQIKKESGEISRILIVHNKGESFNRTLERAIQRIDRRLENTLPLQRKFRLDLLAVSREEYQNFQLKLSKVSLFSGDFSGGSQGNASGGFEIGTSFGGASLSTYIGLQKIRGNIEEVDQFEFHASEREWIRHEFETPVWFVPEGDFGSKEQNIGFEISGSFQKIAEENNQRVIFRHFDLKWRRELGNNRVQNIKSRREILDLKTGVPVEIFSFGQDNYIFSRQLGLPSNSKEKLQKFVRIVALLTLVPRRTKDLSNKGIEVPKIEVEKLPKESPFSQKNVMKNLKFEAKRTISGTTTVYVSLDQKYLSQKNCLKNVALILRTKKNKLGNLKKYYTFLELVRSPQLLIELKPERMTELFYEFDLTLKVRGKRRFKKKGKRKFVYSASSLASESFRELH